MSDAVEQLVHAFERFPGVGPRQARRFTYYLLAANAAERNALSETIGTLTKNVRQCPECFRFWSGSGERCRECSDSARSDELLMLIEKDQDIHTVECANYKGHYFVLGGVLTLSGKGAIREQELLRSVDARIARGLKEIILALSATSEGENTAERVRELLAPYRSTVRITTLGRGLATGSELEYVDAETLAGAFANRKEY